MEKSESSQLLKNVMYSMEHWLMIGVTLLKEV